MNTHTTPRPHHHVACDGVQTVWLPNVPPVRLEVEQAVHKSMDGVIASGTVRDVAMYMHRNDTLRAMSKHHRVTHTHHALTDFIATMDGIRIRRAVTVGI